MMPHLEGGDKHLPALDPAEKFSAKLFFFFFASFFFPLARRSWLQDESPLRSSEAEYQASAETHAARSLGDFFSSFEWWEMKNWS